MRVILCYEPQIVVEADSTTICNYLLFFCVDQNRLLILQLINDSHLIFSLILNRESESQEITWSIQCDKIVLEANKGVKIVQA